MFFVINFFLIAPYKIFKKSFDLHKSWLIFKIGNDRAVENIFPEKISHDF